MDHEEKQFVTTAYIKVSINCIKHRQMEDKVLNINKYKQVYKKD